MLTHDQMAIHLRMLPLCGFLLIRERQKEQLHAKIIQLQKQLDMKQDLELEIQQLKGSLSVLKHMEDDEDAEILNKVDTLQKDLRDKEQSLQDLDALNQTFIMIKERECNDELQEARQALVDAIKELQSHGNIRLKRMGELDTRPFVEAMKQRYNEEDAEERASELCSLWEEYLKDPDWHPFKIIMVEGKEKAKQHLALLSLGEIGRRKDRSSHAQIENIVIESFQSPFEEIKSAASYALGNIVVGNLPKYLPFILDKIDNQQKKQYLLLHCLKEVIVRQSVDKAEFQESSVETIVNLLFNHCESEEEGVHNVVAESLGKIALIEPVKLIPALKIIMMLKCHAT